MKKIIFPVIIIFLFSCGSHTQQPAEANKTFDGFKEHFVEALWKQYPEWASYNGYYNYDSVLTVPDENHRKEELAFAEAWLDSLKKFDTNELKHMLEKAKAKLENSTFETEELTNTLNDLLEETNQKPGVLFSLIRIATTQAPASPGLAETLSLLGKEVTLQRINEQLAHL
mgnify:CR=1 FL=1